MIMKVAKYDQAFETVHKCIEEEFAVRPEPEEVPVVTVNGDSAKKESVEAEEEE